ncbi:MAG TPA: DUF86 domain-containing protein [Candidatus Wolfebacteria bacterium]|nr:DUF86 domain-containing protein [Candidatus Wolfebacteria bacterium]
MSKREDKLYIADIKDSIKKIEEYTKGLDFDEFVKDSMAMDAVVRNLTIIGEAAKNIPEEIKSKNPHIAWTEAISMRNKVTHEYFGVDEDILWQTIKEDLPILKKQISRLAK